MREKSIVQPKPLGKLGRELLIYLPFDPVPSVLGAVLQKKASASRKIGGGSFFMMEGSCVLYQVLGAPAAVLWLEALIVSGISRILLLSFCGSLSPRLRAGDAVVLTKALANEGTSRHYFPRQKIFHPSRELSRQVEDILRHSGLPFTKAPVVSTDAPYRETLSWLRRMQDMGMEAVDMEASAVFALAKCRRVEAASLMLVSDELFSGTWRDDFPPSQLKKKIRDYFLPLLAHFSLSARL